MGELTENPDALRCNVAVTHNKKARERSGDPIDWFVIVLLGAASWKDRDERGWTTLCRED